jgi:guanine deaminase
VLDSSAKSAMEFRMRTATSLAEELFILQTMGDDRCVAEVYVAGKAMKTKGKQADTIMREQLQLA